MDYLYYFTVGSNENNGFEYYLDEGIVYHEKYNNLHDNRIICKHSDGWMCLQKVISRAPRIIDKYWG